MMTEATCDQCLKPIGTQAYRLLDGVLTCGGCMFGEKASNPKDAIGSAKAPMSCVPINVIAELGVAMFEGAMKYGRYNYRETEILASVYFDAALRHLFAWWEGEDIDPDSGLSHVAKAIATLVVLRDSMMGAKLKDDRPIPVKPFYADLNARVAELKEKYKK